MKHVVSVSLGSSARNKTVEVEFLGEPVRVERIGTDGDLRKARETYLELDGRVDCFGIGGCELGVPIGKRYYKLRAVHKLVTGLKTPAVDGLGIRRVVEGQIAQWLNSRPEFQSEFGGQTSDQPLKNSEATTATIAGTRVMFCVGAGRYHMVESFQRAGAKLMLCDAGFLLSLPVYTSSLSVGRFFATVYGPLVSRLPFSVLYPTGKNQNENKPRFRKWFDRAEIIADDFHYIRRNMPDNLDGKVIVTNTTTESDVELLRSRGVRLLCTTTPRLEGRSFGTNVLEATLTAIAGASQPLPEDQIRRMLTTAGIEPNLTKL